MGIDYDDVIDERKVKQERKQKRKPMKIFVDDVVPLGVPLFVDVAAVAGDDDVVVEPPPPAKKQKSKITGHGITTFVLLHL